MTGRAQLPRSDYEPLSLHVDVCPDCGSPAHGHMLDPPSFCNHSRELYVPVRFVEAEITDELLSLVEDAINGALPGYRTVLTESAVEQAARAALAAAFSTQQAPEEGTDA